MTDEEATNFATYEDWEQILVHFTLTNAPDHKERIATKQQKRKARQTSIKKKNAKKKKE